LIGGQIKVPPLPRPLVGWGKGRGAYPLSRLLVGWRKDEGVPTLSLCSWWNGGKG